MTWPHARFGHGVSVGAVAFQFALRERVLLRDWRRFGTATDQLSFVFGTSASLPVLVAYCASAAHRGSMEEC